MLPPVSTYWSVQACAWVAPPPADPLATPWSVHARAASAPRAVHGAPLDLRPVRVPAQRCPAEAVPAAT